MRRCCALLLSLFPVAFAAPKPADWVPARWPWSDARSLDLLAGSPVNCLLVRNLTPEFAAAAADRGAVILALITPGPGAAADVRKAIAARAAGVALEGDFAAADAAAARGAAGSAIVVDLGPRSRLNFAAPIVATNQGVWPGIGVQEDGAHKAGPTGSTWIDTNTGFLRAARAAGAATLWIANQPPAGTVVTGARYLQVIADAAMSGARWVLAFDSDFAARLAKRDADTAAQWRRMGELLAHFEAHPEWRSMREFGQLAVVQDPAGGALLSGGILDMIAVKHTPVRPVPPATLAPDALRGATLAVSVDPENLTAEQKEVLRGFARSGNTLLNAPPGSKTQPRGDRITLDNAELENLNNLWRDVNNLIGRRNLGVRLFNVSSMLSNALESADGNTVILHLVNYADFPVENVAAHFLGDYRRATLLTPGGAEKKLEIYAADEARGVDIDKVAVCATIKLER